MKFRDIIREVEKDGWKLIKQTGSHAHYKHPTKTGKVTIAGSGNEDCRPGTERSIYRQAGLSFPKKGTQ